MGGEAATLRMLVRGLRAVLAAALATQNAPLIVAMLLSFLTIEIDWNGEKEGPMRKGNRVTRSIALWKTHVKPSFRTKWRWQP